ncbi:MAG: phosphatase PAP2 family protein [Microthrixaceae bacterium]|nr:phosphatase PAP2 family protein [Microthrixaceae bacterium]MCO5311894.1 phosphatase PAP2 family protein [Microthrixaceae bacterium]HPB44934.1 phosphatase PAP2 family protein [Microthrixaceae bacterium]
MTNATHPATPGPLGHLLDNRAIEHFDEVVERGAEALRGRGPADRLFYGLSMVGDHGTVWHVIGAGRVALGQESLSTALNRSIALGLEALVLNGPIKWLFRRSRPVVDGDRPLHLRTPRTSSFPSGHSSSGIFSAMLLARTTRVKWPWYVLGAAIGWSRVHVRIHHPSDVVGGYLAGWALGRIAVRILDALDAAER